MGDKFVGGIRIRFPDSVGVPIQKVIPILGRPYKHPFLCPQCGVAHNVKTYHFDLDSDGVTIVSREIAERLKQGGVQFEVLNVVRKPPKIQLNIGGMVAMFRVEQSQKEVTA